MEYWRSRHGGTADPDMEVVEIQTWRYWKFKHGGTGDPDMEVVEVFVAELRAGMEVPCV